VSGTRTRPTGTRVSTGSFESLQRKIRHEAAV